MPVVGGYPRTKSVALTQVCSTPLGGMMVYIAVSVALLMIVVIVFLALACAVTYCWRQKTGDSICPKA